MLIETHPVNYVIETHPVNYVSMKNILACDRGDKDITFACSSEIIYWLGSQSVSHKPIAPL